jgi:hypothetical protein
MSHDLWANFSTVELASDCLRNPSNWFLDHPSSDYQSYALKDPSPNWPLADGAVGIEDLQSGVSRYVAVEFKRINEGIHGILTGLGQVQAYIKKGFAGSVLVIPKEYETLADPGAYAVGVIESTLSRSPIGVFTYDYPDLIGTSPFHDKLRCLKPVCISSATSTSTENNLAQSRQYKTQWAHVREGSTTPDFLYRYLESVLDCSLSPGIYEPEIIPGLEQAVRRISADIEPKNYLSYTSATGRNPSTDESWRRYWFRNILTPSVQQIWDGDPNAGISNASPTRLRQWDGSSSTFFARPGRARRSKPQIAEDVSSGIISELQAWEVFANSVRERAHSLREDIDSGLEALGMLGADGEVTDSGFRFVTACKRANSDANAPGPLSVLRYTVLSTGGFASLLHYIHSLSDRLFTIYPDAFCSQTLSSLELDFQSVPYRHWLADLLRTELRVAGSASLRGGRRRPPLEAEVILLRKLGLINGWRRGLGIEINWPAVHSALELV